jgi:hypothetical protein
MRRLILLGWTWSARVWAPALALFAVALALRALPASSHDWYADLIVPGTTESRCCGGAEPDPDCAPYPHRSTNGELSWELFINGRWWPVPPEKIVQMYSPDGQAHACCWKVGAVHQGCTAMDPVEFRCVVLPGQGV